jgi:hypothetical protein
MRTRQLSGWLASLRRLGEDQQGAAMMILGLAVIPLFVLMGLAVDVGRGYMVKSKLSYAIDSAGLAGGRAFETDLREEDIMMFFEANFPPNYMESEIEGGEPSVTFNDEENTILIEATAIVPTRFMGVAGVHEMRVHARTLIQRELRGMELALVMDNTGSMRTNGGMAAMKPAATKLIDILYGTREEVENFWVALVPYSATVNIGNQHTDWLAQQAYDPDAAWQNADPDSSESFGYHEDHYQPTTWKGCVEARPYPRDSNDDPPSVEGWYPHLWRTTLRNFENDEWEFDDDYVIIVKDDDVEPVTKSSNRLYTQGAPEHSGDTPEAVQYNPNDRETWGPYIPGDNEWNPDGPLSSLREENIAQNHGTGPNLGCGPAITPLVTQKSVVQAAINEMQPWHRGGPWPTSASPGAGACSPPGGAACGRGPPTRRCCRSTTTSRTWRRSSFCSPTATTSGTTGWGPTAAATLQAVAARATMACGCLAVCRVTTMPSRTLARICAATFPEPTIPATAASTKVGSEPPAGPPRAPGSTAACSRCARR